MNIDAMQIRIQLSANLLEVLGPSIDGLIANIKHGQADAEDADKLKDQLELLRATLAILRGTRSDIPQELRGSTIYDGDEAILASDPLRR